MSQKFIYKKLTDTSFEIKRETETAGKYNTEVYKIPDDITTWQVMQFVGFGGEFFKSSSDIGKVIGSAVIGALKSSDSAALKDVADKAMKQMFGDTDGVSEQEKQAVFTKGVLTGVGEMISFIGEEGRLPKYAATLFLLEGEYRIDRGEMPGRIELFECVPVSQLFGGLTIFFGDKVKSLKNIVSRLGTSGKLDATPPSMQQTEILKNLTVTSTGLNE